MSTLRQSPLHRPEAMRTGFASWGENGVSSSIRHRKIRGLNPGSAHWNEVAAKFTRLIVMQNHTTAFQIPIGCRLF